MELKEISSTRTKVKNKEEINEFIALAKSGDKEASIDLMEKYKLDMYRMGKTMLYTEEDIWDDIQETVSKAYKNIKKLQKTESFKS